MMGPFDPAKATAEEWEDLRRRFRAGDDVPDELANELRQNTGVFQWQGDIAARNAVLMPRIIPTKSDADRAQEVKAEMLGLLEPVTALLNKARAEGLIINWQYAQPDGFGRQSLAFLDVTKKLA